MVSPCLTTGVALVLVFGLVFKAFCAEGMRTRLKNCDLFRKSVTDTTAEYTFNFFVKLRHDLDDVQAPVKGCFETSRIFVYRV
jgi:hypothetical protein